MGRERRDCIEVCEHYGKCFDMAAKEQNPMVCALLEIIMNSGDECPLEGRDDGGCVVEGAARAVLQLCKDSDALMDAPALKYYAERFGEDQASGQQQ